MDWPILTLEVNPKTDVLQIKHFVKGTNAVRFFNTHSSRYHPYIAQPLQHSHHRKTTRGFLSFAQVISLAKTMNFSGGNSEDKEKDPLSEAVAPGANVSPWIDEADPRHIPPGAKRQGPIYKGNQGSHSPWLGEADPP